MMTRAFRSLELVLQLVRLVQRPAGADDGADLLDRVVRHHVLRAVVHEQRHRLAWCFDATGGTPWGVEARRMKV
jgi:hypothetical protein